MRLPAEFTRAFTVREASFKTVSITFFAASVAPSNAMRFQRRAREVTLGIASKNRPYDRRMPQSTPTSSRIESLDTRLARLRAERSRLVARSNHAERKRDTRRKILIGGAVLAAIQHEGVPPLHSLDALTRWMAQRLDRPHDRAVFDLPGVDSAIPPTT